MDHDQPLLITLVAVQFAVHALGWSMAAALSGGWRAAEGQFAAFWLLLALGLMLYLPGWPSGSPPRNAAHVLLVCAAMVQHRALVLHWGGKPRDGHYLGGVLVAGLLMLFSLALEHGHRLRVATVCVAAGGMLLASAWQLWTQVRRRAPRLAVLMSAGFTVLALLARAAQALWAAPAADLAIDAPGPTHLALVILVLLMGGLINLAQIQLVLGRVLRRLTLAALTDPLTGTANRRGFIDRLNEVHERALRAPCSSPGYAVLMIDVDHFKAAASPA